MRNYSRERERDIKIMLWHDEGWRVEKKKKEKIAHYYTSAS
jgi:hypothetical protein